MNKGGNDNGKKCRRYEARDTDGGRNVLKKCGKCGKKGLGRNWGRHWDKCHHGQVPYGTVRVKDLKRKSKIEISLEKFEKYAKKRKRGKPRRSAPAEEPADSSNDDDEDLEHRLAVAEQKLASREEVLHDYEVYFDAEAEKRAGCWLKELRQKNAGLKEENAELKARVAELEKQLQLDEPLLPTEPDRPGADNNN